MSKMWSRARSEMKLYLIRHGKTEANEKRLYCGSTDIPLSKKGREEIAESGHTCMLENNWAGVKFITSGMHRSDETLKLLFGDVPFETDERFREIDFGIFEMKSYEELKDLPAYQEWILGDNEANIPPKGESGLHMKKRVLEALEEILKAGRDTVVVSHGGVIALIMQTLFDGEKKSRYEWQPDFGHGYIITNDKYTSF